MQLPGESMQHMYVAHTVLLCIEKVISVQQKCLDKLDLADPVTKQAPLCIRQSCRDYSRLM
jgi:hypothetical protein